MLRQYYVDGGIDADQYIHEILSTTFQHWQKLEFIMDMPET